MPCHAPSASVVTTVTPLGHCPSTSRNVAASTATNTPATSSRIRGRHLAIRRARAAAAEPSRAAGRGRRGLGWLSARAETRTLYQNLGKLRVSRSAGRNPLLCSTARAVAEVTSRLSRPATASPPTARRRRTRPRGAREPAEPRRPTPATPAPPVISLAGDHHDEHKGSSQSIAAVERAIDVLLLFGRDARPDLGVTEISTDLGLSKAAVHRILTSLRSRDLITLDPVDPPLRARPGLARPRPRLPRADRRPRRWPRPSSRCSRPSRARPRRSRSATATAGCTSSRSCPNREVRMEVAIGVPYPLHAGALVEGVPRLPHRRRGRQLRRAQPAAGDDRLDHHRRRARCAPSSPRSARAATRPRAASGWPARRRSPRPCSTRAAGRSPC